MSKQQTLIDKYKAIQAIGTDVEMPWHVMRLFSGENGTLSVMGDQVCLGEDYVSVQDAREGLNWLVTQLGGTVKWEEIIMGKKENKK